MAATMQDVAKLAGVSIKTVSNVVNAYPHVRPATREKVTAAIAELGYTVNLTARSLRRGRSGLVGLAVPELRLAYFAELADALIAVADERGLNVLIEQTAYDGDRERDALVGERRRLTDGLILNPLVVTREELDAMTLAYPLVLLGERIFGSRHDHVTMDNESGAHSATAHLIGRGCRRIVFVGADPVGVQGTAVLRLQGYRRALVEANLELEPALVRASGLWHRDTGYRAVESLLDEGVAFDGIFAANDALAIGALAALRRHGRRVPEDVAVVGFDDVEEAQYTSPTLTSIAPDKAAIARLALDRLVFRIDEVADRRPPAPPQTLHTRHCLIVRESSAR